MRLELATQNDFDAIIAFYDDVTERTPDMTVYARWSKGKHPTEEGIKAYINEGSMYIYRERGVIVGAMAVTMYQGEDYHAIDWSQQVTDDKVAVIHILAVSPDIQGKGIGSEMIREAIRMAKSKGMQPSASMPSPQTHPPTKSTSVSALSIAANSTSTLRTQAGQTSISLSIKTNNHKKDEKRDGAIGIVPFVTKSCNSSQKWGGLQLFYACVASNWQNI